MALALSVLFGLTMPVTSAQAGELGADITIGSVRLTHRLVLRVDATYVCPAGWEPTRSPRASASQQTEVDPSSRDKEFGPVVCDGAPHDVRVRLVHPRDPRGAAWEFGAITHVNVHFYAREMESPFAETSPQDMQSLITMPSTDAPVAADVAVGRVSLTDRDALRVAAFYMCPSDMAVVPGLSPSAYVSQGGVDGPSSLKRFENIVCDGTRNRLLIRLAHPRRPEGATWQPGTWTMVTIYIFASTSDHTRSVSASHIKASLVV